MARTNTSKNKLPKHDTGDLNWGGDYNEGLDVLDEHAQRETLRPPRTLIAVLGSGAVGAELAGSTTYFYKVTAINAVGESTEGKIPTVVEAAATQGATPVPVIIEWEAVEGASGYRVYKGTASGAEEFLLEKTGGATITHTDDGNTAVAIGQNVPAANTARTSVTGLRATGEAAPLRGDVKFKPGANVTLTQLPGTNELEIAAAGGGGAWVKVADIVPSDSNSFPLLSGLNLTTDRVWRITLQWINPTLNDTQIKLILNGAGSNEYGWQELKVDGTAITAQRAIGSGVGVIGFCKGGGGSGNFDIILQPAGVAGSDVYGGCMAHSRGQTATRGFPQPPIMYQHSLLFELIADITSIQIAAVTAGTLGANSRLQLLRLA
ncbi:MAG: hypothetical protein CO113_05935 [Elusimicrobia bacterium CG_4_9_14_3_um_filter_62_55]|nr:MAG: hypothetical protein COR54_12555 [Elusimicrobia bacterium CG22_combo_CG10-13_8_21_14_all_63_91]PJA16607.1 MAG: hypothetical protein COX66_07135 [Elusimicrobia bacterium CG_4_10_14_0_2_um_filter_63_34]PJB25970.1 MAG: hypothetical protein CO113_05935 [Elusimicrobia bacterium CG_4_9_14_3_um_filter_62_55]